MKWPWKRKKCPVLVVTVTEPLAPLAILREVSADDRLPCPDGKCIIQQERDVRRLGTWFTHGVHWEDIESVPQEHKWFLPDDAHAGGKSTYPLFHEWLNACHRPPEEAVSVAISGEFDEAAERARLMPV